MKHIKPIAAIILNWNGEALLRRFLPQVVANSDPEITRIVVADNGSSDGSVELLKKEFDGKVDIIAYDSNLGFAAGYNRAILEAGSHPYCALLNSDLATDPGWDHALLEFMEGNPDVGACQPKILNYNDPTRFDYAGACGGYLDCNGYPYCRGRIFGVCETDNGQYDTVADVFWASGAALMIRRKLYLALGGLDPQFFAHMEEIDLCWRVRLAGYRVTAVPAASVRHLGGGSLPTGNPFKVYLNFRNNLLMMHKNLPDSVRRHALRRRRLLDALAWLHSVTTLHWRAAAAILRAHRHFRRMRNNYVAHPDTDVLPDSPDSRRNILVEYYFRGHRRYSELDGGRRQ